MSGSISNLAQAAAVDLTAGEDAFTVSASNMNFTSSVATVAGMRPTLKSN